MTIFLCGFMGCGKSTIGQRLAKKLNCPFTDMDSYIEEQAGLCIPEIFEKHGEAHFRDIETEAIRELAGQPGVIACGGGAMLRDENAKIARENGTVVFLDVPFQMCYQRISKTDRPIVQCSTRQELQTLYQKRQGIYCRHSNYRIEAIHSPAQTVQKIIETLQSRTVNYPPLVEVGASIK